MSDGSVAITIGNDSTDKQFYSDQKLFWFLFINFIKIWGLSPISICKEADLNLKITLPWKAYQLAIMLPFCVLNYLYITSMNSGWDILNTILKFSHFSNYIASLFLQVWFIAYAWRFRNFTEEVIITSKTLHKSFWRKMNYLILVQVFVNILHIIIHIIQWKSVIKIFTCNNHFLRAFMMIFGNIITILWRAMKEVNDSIKSDKFDLLTFEKKLKRIDDIWGLTEILTEKCRFITLYLIVNAMQEFLINASEIGHYMRINSQIAIWALFNICHLLLILVPCSLLSSEAKRTKWLIYLTTLDDDSYLAKDKVETIGLKLRHRDNNVRAGGVLILNMGLLRSLIGVTFTYGIIVFQFQRTELTSFPTNSQRQVNLNKK